MYFPYLRGRQYELLALQELAKNDLLNNHIIPIIEPVKLSPTLVKTISEYIRVKQPVSVIVNPMVGSFLNDCKEVKEATKESQYKNDFLQLCNNEFVIKSLIMNVDTTSCLKRIIDNGSGKDELLIINSNREFLEVFDQEFVELYPKYVLIPDERAFKHRVNQNRVIFNDRFEKQNRNKDYQIVTNEFFSDDHLYYEDEKFIGFSDYSIVGDEYSVAGFAPYAVAIHIVYFEKDGSLWVKHFVSETNEGIENPAKKFYEAVTKLVEWYKTSTVELTQGLKMLLEHYEKQTYPGLGSIKKLSIMHHLELIGKFLNKR